MGTNAAGYTYTTKMTFWMNAVMGYAIRGEGRIYRGFRAAHYAAHGLPGHMVDDAERQANRAAGKPRTY